MLMTYIVIAGDDLEVIMVIKNNLNNKIDLRHLNIFWP